MSRVLRVLGVFAHPDDEVICAGGTLAQYVADGAEVMVVSATRGEAGQILDSRVATRATLGRVREQELRDACARVGVQHVRCLDYLDGTLRGADRQVLTAEIAAIADDFEPEVVITFGKDGGYGHTDHVVIGEVATNVCRTQRLYHCHFPQGGVMLAARLAEWLVQLGTRFAGSEEFAHALCVLASEATMMRLARDTVKVAWYPSGARIVEAQEAASRLHLGLAGRVEVFGQSDGGGPVVPAQLVCCDASAWIDQRCWRWRPTGPSFRFGEKCLRVPCCLRCSVVNISCPPIDRPGRGLTPTKKAARPRCAPVHGCLQWRRERGHRRQRPQP